jgi:hypothetical protein
MFHLNPPLSSLRLNFQRLIRPRDNYVAYATRSTGRVRVIEKISTCLGSKILEPIQSGTLLSIQRHYPRDYFIIGRPTLDPINFTPECVFIVP